MTRRITLLWLLTAPLAFAGTPVWESHVLDHQFFSEGATAGDINGDGVPDVVSGPFWYAGPDFKQRTAFYPPKPFDPHGYSDNFFAYVEDFNRDGRGDILVVGFPGAAAYWFENPGSTGTQGETYWNKHLVLDSVDNESPTFTDLTGDGKRELVCSRGGFFGYAQPNSQNPNEPWEFHPISDQSAGGRFTHGLGVGDVNGDGRADLLEKTGWWEQPRTLAGNPRWTKHPVEFSAAGGSQMFTSDFDGDGDLDVVTSLEAHGYGVAWYEQQRQEDRIRFERHLIVGKQPAESEYGVVFSQPHALAIGDIDRDGLPDIVTGKRPWAHGPSGDAEPNAEPVLYWFRGTRLPKDQNPSFEFVPHRICNDGGVGVDVQLHDVNQDGALDVVVGSKRGTFLHLQKFFTDDDLLTEVSSHRSHTIPHRQAARMKQIKDWPTEGLAPLAAAAQMTVPQGFHVDLIAGEPDLHQPIAFCFDLRGRIWVAEAFTYPKRAAEGEGKDKIQVFEDLDGDGSFEKRTTFMEGLNLVSGLEVGFGGVWVGAAPNLLFIPDRNEDLKPDATPQIVLDGWGYQDTHETLNSFTWGPDGWLYGCHGVFTHSRVGAPGTPQEQRIPLNAGVWRYHPTQQRFELFAEGTSNPWGIDFDEHGQAVITACVIPHAFHVIQGGRYHRQAGQHFNPYTFQDIKTIADHLHYAGNIADHAWWGRNEAVHEDATSAAGGGHAHCGAMIYLGDNWPVGYRGSLFMGNIHGNRINCNLLRGNGASFIASHGDDFLFANDHWFRLISLKYGPDGAVYFIDWYDKNACHRNQPEIWDRTNGRLYRVRYGELKKVKPGEHTFKRQNDGFFGEFAPLLAIEQENQWIARGALRAIREKIVEAGGPSRDWKRMRSEVLDEFRNEEQWRTEPSWKRLNALWAIHAIEPLSDQEAIHMLDDFDPNVRSWSIQLALDTIPSPSPGALEQRTALVKKMTSLAHSESSWRVRLYLASALQRLDISQRWSLAEALASHSDSQFDASLSLLIWYGIEPLVGADPQRAMNLAAVTKIPLVRQFIYRRAAADPSLVGALVGSLADAQHPQEINLMLQELRGSAEKLGRIEMPARWPEVVKKLENAKEADVRAAVEFLSISYGDRSIFPKLRQLATNTEAGTEVRAQALASLEQGKDDQLGALALSLLDDEKLRGAAVDLLGKIDQAQAVEEIVKRYADWPTSLKAAGIHALVCRASSARSLLVCIEQGTIPRADLTAVHVGKIQQLGDPELIAHLERVWGSLRVTPEETQRQIDMLKNKLGPEQLQLADRQQGRQVFMKACGTCHRLFGEGAELGPDLTGANRSNLDYLLVNILDPNALVGKDYQTVSVLTDDGRTINGLIKEETTAALVLHDSQKLVTIPRSEIEQIKPTTNSLMPEGLLKPLTETEIAQLLAYLQSPSQVPLAGAVAPIDETTGRVPGAIEGESLKGKATAGTVSPQGMAGFPKGRWSGVSQLWWTGAKPEAKLELPFEVAAEGTYEVILVVTKARDYAIVTFAIDQGTPSAPHDLFNFPEVVVNSPISLGEMQLSQGTHRLEVTLVGCHPKAVPGYMFGLDFIYLRKCP